MRCHLIKGLLPSKEQPRGNRRLGFLGLMGKLRFLDGILRLDDRWCSLLQVCEFGRVVVPEYLAPAKTSVNRPRSIKDQVESLTHTRTS